MNQTLNDLIKSFVILMAVIDPIGTVPVFIEATKNFDKATKKKIAIKATLIASIILIFFIVAGQVMLESMHISLSAFQISGGVVLFIFSLTMVFGHGKPEEEIHLIKDYKHVTVFPIAIPSIASPGAIMAVVLLTDNYQFSVLQQFQTTLIVILILIITLFLLMAARVVQEKIGETGVLVISKIMGLILASVAVESVLTGIKNYFNI